MKNKRAVKILFAMFVILFFVLVSKSLNSVDAANFSAPYAHAYDMSGEWTAYCREHGKALGGDIGGLKFDHLEYNKDSSSQQIEPATGYAYYCGESKANLQNIIWYSKIWTGGSNSVVDADSRLGGTNGIQKYINYGNVYYGIIKPFKDAGGTNLFSITSDTTEDKVKVMVNQQDGKYIVGPYKIKLNIGDNEKIKDVKVSKNDINKGINDAKEVLRNDPLSQKVNKTLPYETNTGTSSDGRYFFWKYSFC